MSDAPAIDLIELLIVLDPPRPREDASRDAEVVVATLKRAGYNARVSDLRGEDE